MSARAAAAERSPVSVDLKGLIDLRPAGEAIRLTAPRVRAFAAGGNLSPFKGRGVEFDESRPYQAGDDLRTMDWRVTARTGKPYTKVFREERNRPVIVWLDLRRSMLFATRRAYKAVAAAELAGLVAWSAVGHGDQLGGLVFTEGEHHEQRPRLGGRSALRLLQLITASSCWTEDLTPGTRADEASSTEGDTDRALLRLTRVARPGSMLFLISDFQALSADFERHIRELASHGDVFLVHMFDPVEAELPPPGRYRIQLGSRSFTIETADARNRERHREKFALRRERLRTLAATPGVALIECSTADDPHEILSKRFARA
jgi:uncharacterized protein (DUF58 family)